MTELLEIHDLRVAFGGREAVRGVELTVGRGKTLAVVGESGCGKSLTALALLGLAPPAAHVSGSATLGGTELIGRADRELRRLRGKRAAMIFQDPMSSLNPTTRIGTQIAEVLAIHTSLGRRERLRRAVELMESVGITDAARRAKQMPHELSGGMRQRVMISIALAGSPELLIADEPTTALDVTVQAQVLALLRERTRDTALLFITHDMGVVAEIADRVAVMYAGRVVETGTVRAILETPRHPYTAALLRSVPDPDRPVAGELPTIPGQVPAVGAKIEGCPFRPRCGHADDTCHTTPPLTGGVACWHPRTEVPA
ncbi:ABC transporter ATP-binding protein [Amycolatopsis jiangsuensis]|uniref:Oligopeptide/dipeptide ABC transporter ATP-binding protein n=1 Tax=Amycolatopsis jiangsuensis TaxID=1181879 RepID=A0A840IQU6_9PSEU|nr:ABC transporter ATP-binding protein [Amycolatopsis jiangsuensis]MBB4683919.1 oligopeptide/dipeptide ABC transporter ATP-binding protein [Amycolatopsis jiangsuensis]